MRRAKKEYRAILSAIPAFDRDDRFLVNILSAAVLAAVYRNLREKPGLGAVTTYYREAMSGSAVMKRLLRKQDMHSPKAQAKLIRDAEASRGRTNPYTWKFRYEAGESPDSYTAYFDACGICRLFRELGIAEIIPALCAYDYEMARLGGTAFTRRQTLAGGGTLCDCHYQKKAGA